MVHSNLTNRNFGFEYFTMLTNSLMFDNVRQGMSICIPTFYGFSLLLIISCFLLLNINTHLENLETCHFYKKFREFLEISIIIFYKNQYSILFLLHLIPYFIIIIYQNNFYLKFSSSKYEIQFRSFISR